MFDIGSLFGNEYKINDIMVCGPSKISIKLAAVQQNSRCPLCQKASARVHSHYGRALMDLPILGCQVALELASRKFFCDNPQCRRRVFTERFTRLIKSYARTTNRLGEQLSVLAFAMSGMTGSNVTRRLGMWISHDTCGRLIRATPLASPAPRLIGVDDWAYRSGRLKPSWITTSKPFCNKA
jgi:transposase